MNNKMYYLFYLVFLLSISFQLSADTVHPKDNFPGKECIGFLNNNGSIDVNCGPCMRARRQGAAGNCQGLSEKEIDQAIEKQDLTCKRGIIYGYKAHDSSTYGKFYAKPVDPKRLPAELDPDSERAIKIGSVCMKE